MEAEKKDSHPHDFTNWLANKLKIGKTSLLTYLPFLPALFSTAFGIFKESKYFHLEQYSYHQVFQLCILIQVFIIFFIIIYQVSVFSRPADEHQLFWKIGNLIEERIDVRGNETLPFKDAISVDKKMTWEELRHEFQTAARNVLYFKIAWIVLWANWFCYYIAMYFDSDSSKLFDILMITETMSYGTCYYLLTYPLHKSKGADLHQWMGVILAVLLFALCIADQSTHDEFVPQMITSVLKVLFGCTFLGLLIAVMTKIVKRSPSWVKVILFLYVALQPLLFSFHELPIITKVYFKNTAFSNFYYSPAHIDSLSKRIDTATFTLNSSIQLKQPLQADVEIVQKNDSSIKISEFRQTLKLKSDSVVMGNPTQIFSSLTKTLKSLEILSINLCLMFKYILMFYFIWLLEREHLFLFFFRTHREMNFIKNARKEFEAELNRITDHHDPTVPDAPSKT